MGTYHRNSSSNNSPKPNQGVENSIDTIDTGLHLTFVKP